MIINIRGTSGSGKTTVINAIRDQIPDLKPMYEDGRKRPIGYVSDERKLTILGHYETACGGCDTISGYDRIFALAQHWADQGYNVLMEGLLVSEETKRTVALAEAHQMVVYLIDIPIETCIDSINMRRRAKKPDAEPVNPTNTTRRVGVIERACDRLEKAGVNVVRGDREGVLEGVRQCLSYRM